MAQYELAFLGSPTPEDRTILANTLGGMLSEFALELGVDVILYDGTTVSGRDKRVAFAAAYFGGEDQGVDIAALGHLIDSNAPVIPTLMPGQDLTSFIPERLRAAHGLWRQLDDPGMIVLAAALLECVGLLRRQRRVFISYRRTEARATAVQMHDLLTMRGFDAFLDTHDIHPGDPFQDVLWHRLVDSDVVLMLDTPSYFASRWTRKEIGRARAQNIQVLRVIWPEHNPSKLMELSETVYLEPAELTAADGPIADSLAERIMLRVELLRSKSIAARYMAITGKFRAELKQIDATFDGVGNHRSISVRLSDNRRVWAYPVVGIPTAETLNDIAEAAKRADQDGVPILIYDHAGIGDTWNTHLNWLDEQIRAVKAIKVSEAAWRLAAWED